MQVQFLREKFSSLDIEVDGGLSPSTIDTAAQVCVCVCVSYNHFSPPSLFPLTPSSSPSSSLSGLSKGLLYIHVTHFNMLTTRCLVVPQLVVSCLPFISTYIRTFIFIPQFWNHSTLHPPVDYWQRGELYLLILCCCQEDQNERDDCLFRMYTLKLVSFPDQIFLCPMCLVNCLFYSNASEC